MKPDVNKIFAKLKAETPITKLASQKVELGITEEIQKAQGSGSSLLKEAKGLAGKLKAADKDLVNKVKAAVKEANRIDDQDQKIRKEIAKETMKIANILDKAETAARDLGVDYKGIKGFGSLEKLYNDLDDIEGSDFLWTDLGPLVRSI